MERSKRCQLEADSTAVAIARGSVYRASMDEIEDEPGPDPAPDEARRGREISARRARGVETASRYVQKLLLPILGLAGARFEIVPTTAGLRSLVYFLTIDGAPRRLVLRCVSRRDNVRWLAAAFDIFAVNNVPAPRHVHR